MWMNSLSLWLGFRLILVDRCMGVIRGMRLLFGDN